MDKATYVIPTKCGCWRAVTMSSLRHAYWRLAWNKWWHGGGFRMERSLEMWRK